MLLAGSLGYAMKLGKPDLLANAVSLPQADEFGGALPLRHRDYRARRRLSRSRKARQRRVQVLAWPTARRAFMVALVVADGAKPVRPL